jgi:hypothetical protein
MENQIRLTGEQQEKLAERHYHQIKRVGMCFGLPEWYEIKYEGAKGHSLFGHLRHFGDAITYTFQDGKLELGNHASRVALDSVVLADALGFGRSSKYEHQGFLFVDAAISHDDGKLDPRLIDLAEKKVGFTRRDRKRMKEHAWRGLYCLDEAIPIKLDHHRWQRNSYSYMSPFWNTLRKWTGRYYIKRTPESNTLSKFLGIIDFHDSAATRANTRNYSEPRLPSSEELRDLLTNEYGRLRIKYHGEKLPRMDMSGRELIEELFRRGVFGRANVFDPYPEPFSFVVRPTDEETVAVRNALGQRENEITAKIKRYDQLELEEYEKKRLARKEV